jgi:hypothetical protein
MHITRTYTELHGEPQSYTEIYKKKIMYGIQ